jgi:hypothetical protein
LCVDSELGEDGFDFFADGHGWLVVSVEVVGVGWQTGGYPHPGGCCVKSSKQMV